jgi:hypothetical protein
LGNAEMRIYSAELVDFLKRVKDLIDSGMRVPAAGHMSCCVKTMHFRLYHEGRITFSISSLAASSPLPRSALRSKYTWMGEAV